MADVRFDFPTAALPTASVVFRPSLVSITRKRAFPVQQMEIAVSGKEWIRELNTNVEEIWEIDFLHLHETDSGIYNGFTALDAFIRTTINFSQFTFEITDADFDTLIVRYMRGLETFEEGGGRGRPDARTKQYFGTLVCRKTL